MPDTYLFEYHSNETNSIFFCLTFIYRHLGSLSGKRSITFSCCAITLGLKGVKHSDSIQSNTLAMPSHWRNISFCVCKKELWNCPHRVNQSFTIRTILPHHLYKLFNKLVIGTSFFSNVIAKKLYFVFPTTLDTYYFFFKIIGVLIDKKKKRFCKTCYIIYEGLIICLHLNNCEVNILHLYLFICIFFLWFFLWLFNFCAYIKTWNHTFVHKYFR